MLCRMRVQKVVFFFGGWTFMSSIEIRSYNFTVWSVGIGLSLHVGV